MRGSVDSYTTKAGQRLWRIRYDLPPGPDGKRRSTTKRGFKRQRDAERALHVVFRSLEDGSFLPSSTLTVEQYLVGQWLPSRHPTDDGSGRGHRGKLAIATHDSYRTYIDAYITPMLGAVQLQKLTRSHLEQLYDLLESRGGRGGDGLSPKTVANVHGVLHKALGDAVKWSLIPTNVAALVEPPRAPKPTTKVWSVQELRTFLTHVRSDRLYALWLLLATTGMRCGEAVGLTWDDLDIEAATVSISWTLGVVDNRATWKPRPKTAAGQRILALDPATTEALRQWRTRQAKERLAAGEVWQRRQQDWRGRARTDLVVTWQDGRLIHPERITTAFRRHVQDAGLPAIRLHDLRHTYATAALATATGWQDVKVISQRLGHASIGITLDTYAHVLPQTDAAAANTLARAILGE